MDKKLDLSIVIVNYNTGRLLLECLESIFKCIEKVRFEIFVVDNNSADESCKIAQQKFPQINFIHNKNNIGFTRANNQAIRLFKGKKILLLNPDTKFIDNSIEKMATFLNENSSVAVVGPRLLNSDMSWQLTGNTFPTLFNIFIESLFLDRLFPKSKIFGLHKRSYRNPVKTYSVDWVMGACLMVKRSMIEEGLEERVFMYFEDTDLCYQIKQKGKEVYYFGEAKVIHYGGVDFFAYNRQKIIEYHKSLFYFFKKHYSLQKLRMLNLLIFVRSIIRLVLWTSFYPFCKTFASEKINGYWEVMKIIKF